LHVVALIRFLEAFFDEAPERARKIWYGYEIVSRGQTLQKIDMHSLFSDQHQGSDLLNFSGRN